MRVIVNGRHQLLAQVLQAIELGQEFVEGPRGGHGYLLGEFKVQGSKFKVVWA